MAVTGFLSYAHLDNDNSNGRISEIARDLKAEYMLLSGDTLNLFFDKEIELSGLRWGDEWKEVIDSRLERSAFFIPVLSPTFLRRAECRSEFLRFRGLAKGRGEEQLLLPILFADLSRSDADDEIARIAESLQWIDWTRTRLEDHQSSESKKLIHVMATRLLHAQESMDSDAEREQTRSSENQTANALHHADIEGDIDDAPGTEDMIADAEAALTEYGSLLSQYSKSLQEVSSTFPDATRELSTAKTYAKRLVVYRRIANDIQPHIDRCYEIAVRLAESTTKADPGIQAILSIVEHWIDTEGNDESESHGWTEFLSSLENTTTSLLSMIETASSVTPMIKQLEGQTREMRPTMSRLRKSIALIEDSKAAFSSWFKNARLLSEQIATDPPPTKETSGLS